MATATLYRNGRIHTRSVAAATALVVDSGRIVWVGTETGCAEFRDLPTVDLAGHWLAPGFVDGHVHLADTGLAMQADLSSAGNRSEFRALVEKLPRLDRVLLAHGWDDSAWAEPPDWSDLPADRPVYASRIDLHTAVVNEALVALAPQLPTVEGWEPDGLVRGAAHELARRTAMALCSPAERLAHAQLGLSAFAANGVVAVHEMAGPMVTGLAEAQLLAEWSATAADIPEVFLWWGGLADFETAARIGAFGVGGDLFIDGSLGSRTAALNADYADATGRGNRYLTDAEILAHLTACTGAGRRSSFHAIGDAAVESLIDAWQSVARQFGESEFAAQQHQIEHAMMIDSRMSALLARLNIAVSAQPQFEQRWGGVGGMYQQRLGADRCAGLLPLASLNAAGVPLILGSDAPVTGINPWLTVQAAMSLHNHTESLSSRAAFNASTRTAYRRAGRQAGEIAVGMEANFAVWAVPEFKSIADAGGRWSGDTRSGVLELPDLAAGFPECRLTVRAGIRLFAEQGWT